MRVYNIGDYQVEHKTDNFGFAPKGECSHTRTVADDAGQIITCKDCKVQLSPYWLLMKLNRYFTEESKRIEMQRKAFKEEQERGVTLKAAQEVEHAWRSRKYLPSCPHCNKPIMPQDGFGKGHVSKSHFSGVAKTLEMKPQLSVVQDV